VTPETRARKFPSIFPEERPSRKKKTMPVKTSAQVITSNRLGFSLKKSHIMPMRKAGAVYCRMIVLAAVVSLLEIMKRKQVKNVKTPPNATPQDR